MALGSGLQDCLLGERGMVRLWVKLAHPLRRKRVGHPLVREDSMKTTRKGWAIRLEHRQEVFA